MELNPVKFIHLFMCRVWQEIYSLPIAFSLFLSPHFSLWADVYCMFGLNGMSKTQSLFILHQKHSFKWPDIFLERLDGPHHNMRWFPPSARFFFSPSSLKMYFYFSSIKPVVSLRLFVDFLCRYNNFLRDLTENTSPDSAEFQQLSSKSFFFTFLSQNRQQTHTRPCDKNVDGFIQPGLFILSIYWRDLFLKCWIEVTQSPRLLRVCLPF